MPLCEVCEALDIDTNSRLGEYTELVRQAQAGCEACKFYCDILQSSSRWSDRIDKLPGNLVFLHSQRLDVRAPGREDYSSFSCDDLLLDYVFHENYTGLKDENTDIRRIIPVHSADEVCSDQLGSWLGDCERHKDCPALREVALPTRIIQVSPDPVVDSRLILSDGIKGKYIVLSHAPHPAEEHELKLAENGYQYLWIPALCNPQDESSQISLESSDLPTIYGQAALMTATPNSDDLDSGIFHPRKVFYSPALGKNKDRYMRQKLLRWDTNLKIPSSTSRGWNALERILSPKIVHYTKRQMIFECVYGLRFEAAGIPDKVTGSGQVRMSYEKGFVQPFVTSYLEDQDLTMASKSTEGGVKKDVSTRLEAYHQTLGELSNHTFSTPKQKALATSIIAQIINPNQQLGFYISSLLTSHSGSSLAWGRSFAVLTPTSSYIAPSWSLHSVDGNISSLFLDRNPAMFIDQKQNPSFISHYTPRLITHDVLPVNDQDPYGPAKEGSSITISGCVTSLMSPLRKVQEDEENTFHPTFVLDKSWAMDCATCSNHAETFSEEEIANGKGRAESEMGHCVVLFLEGGFWGLGLGEGVVDGVVLSKRGSGGLGGEDRAAVDEGWERAGFLRLSLEYKSNAGWEREDRSLIGASWRGNLRGWGGR